MSQSLENLTPEEYEALSSQLKGIRQRRIADRLRDEWQRAVLIDIFPAYCEFRLNKKDSSFSAFVEFWDTLSPDLIPKGVRVEVAGDLCSQFDAAFEGLSGPTSVTFVCDADA